MWIIKSIYESDYGCEERMPGEPDTVLVVLESDDGQICQTEVTEDWLNMQNLDEGDEWPLEPDVEEKQAQAIKMAEWMDNYLAALDEYEG